MAIHGFEGDVQPAALGLQHQALLLTPPQTTSGWTKLSCLALYRHQSQASLLLLILR